MQSRSGSMWVKIVNIMDDDLIISWLVAIILVGIFLVVSVAVGRFVIVVAAWLCLMIAIGGVSGLMLVVVMGLSFVCDIGYVTRIIIDVIIDILFATVGEDDVVIASRLIAIAAFVFGHVDVVVVVQDGIFVIVMSWCLYTSIYDFYL